MTEDAKKKLVHTDAAFDPAVHATPEYLSGMFAEKPCYHSSREGAQFGDQTLEQFAADSKEYGAAGIHPCYHMLLEEDGVTIKSAADIKGPHERHELKEDGWSAHVLFWALLMAKRCPKEIRQFLPEVAWKGKTPEEVQAWVEAQIEKLADRAVECGVHQFGMFWPDCYEGSAGKRYRWGMMDWKDKSKVEPSGSYDYVAEALDMFANGTEKVRKILNDRNLVACHEVHLGSMASCIQEYRAMQRICDNDPCLRNIGDPSHCWLKELWSRRYGKAKDGGIGEETDVAHWKNFKFIDGKPLLVASGDWNDSGVVFAGLEDPNGEVDMVGYGELLYQCGYPHRYCLANKTETAPAIVEAERHVASRFVTSKNGIVYVNQKICIPMAGLPFDRLIGEVAA